AKLINGRPLVRIAHEVYVALHNVWVELQRVLEHRSIFCVLLVTHHVHEGAVIDTMHSQCSDEVTLHQPEGFGEQKCSRNLGSYSVDDFPPELMRHMSIELGTGHPVFRSGGNCSAAAGAGKPEPVKVALC